MQRGTLHCTRTLLLFTALAAIALALAGCGASQAGVAPAPRESVSIQLSWVHEYSSAEFYAAEKNGRFAAQGLDVRLYEGGFSDKGYIDPIEQVVGGTVDFGMSDASTILLARAAGKPVVAVGTVLQRSPLAVISLDKTGIARPQDLIGRRVAVAEGGASQVFNALLTSQDIDLTKLSIVPRTTYGIEPLINGEVDALVGWMINEGVQVREAGHTPSFLPMSDYGVDTYDILMFTTEKMIAERPHLVERLLRGVTDGIQDVVSSPNEAANLTLTYNSELDLEGQRQRIQASLPLLNPPGSPLGAMQPEIWRTTYDILRIQGVLRQPIAVESAYTLTFLNAIHGK